MRFVTRCHALFRDLTYITLIHRLIKARRVWILEISIIYDLKEPIIFHWFISRKTKMSDMIWEEMANRMKPGVRVVRGKDWQWATQGGNGPGTVLKASKTACWW